MTRTTGWIALALVVGLALSAWTVRSGEEGGAVGSAEAGPPCPPGGREVPAGSALQPLLDSVPAGSVLCLASGSYDGPVVIPSRLALQGPADAVIRSGGSGTTVRVLADGAALRGFSVEGSGRRYDLMDAAVYVRGDDTEVRRLNIRDALFGIVAERSNGVTIAGNEVKGLKDLPVGSRGDGIRLWEVRASTVAHNRLEDSRDIVVWYSPNNRLVGNRVVRSRYATHFMYSDDCLVEDAHYERNIVGVFIMYSRGITLRGNEIADAAEADGMGVGVKESGNLVLEGNRFLRDRECLYLDTSPFRSGDTVTVRRNTFVRCSSAVTFHSSEKDNTFTDNTFLGNETQVAVEGRGTARKVEWRGNYFDDYQGYDLNGDGFGDVAYELRSLSEGLVSRHPELALFRGTPALEMLDLAGRVLPLLEPETILRDPRPRMAPSTGRPGPGTSAGSPSSGRAAGRTGLLSSSISGSGRGHAD